VRRMQWISWAFLAVLAAGCRQQTAQGFAFVGQDTMTGRQVNLQPGAMPSGEMFSGFYRSQLMGDINMQQTGDAVVADYEYDRAQCHVLGHLEGTVEGNLLRFSWREDKRACGFQTPILGRGFMLYEVSQEGEVRRGHLYGEIGLNDSDRGDGTLVAVKVPDREPVLRSQQSSGGDGSGTGEGSGDGAGATGSGSGS
jgi:hypothetical protein